MASTRISLIRGPQGVQGALGPQGVQGVQGLPGVNAVANDTATASYVTTSGSATEVAVAAKQLAAVQPGAAPRAVLDLAYAQRGMPAAAIAAGSTGSWDPARFVYNQKASNTRKLRAGLGKAKAGADTAGFKLAFAPADSTNVGFPVRRDLNAPAVAVRKLLAANGYPVKGTGPVVANPGGALGTGVATNTRDARYTFVGAWTSQASNINGVLESGATGAEIIFTSDLPGTVVEFCSVRLGASFEWFIDGVSQGTVTQDTAGSLVRYSATGLSDTTHVVRIVRTAGTYRHVWTEVRRATAGVSCANLAVGGSTAAIWDRTESYFPLPVLLNYAPTVCENNLGINDHGTTTSTPEREAAFKASTLSTLNKQIAAGIEPYLVTPTPSEGKDMSGYCKAYYELADQLDIWLLDMHAIFETYAISNGLGLMADSVHQNEAGYDIKGTALFRALTGL